MQRQIFWSRGSKEDRDTKRSFRGKRKEEEDFEEEGRKSKRREKGGSKGWKEREKGMKTILWLERDNTCVHFGTFADIVDEICTRRAHIFQARGDFGAKYVRPLVYILLFINVFGFWMVVFPITVCLAPMIFYGLEKFYCIPGFCVHYQRRKISSLAL